MMIIRILGNRRLANVQTLVVGLLSNREFEQWRANNDSLGPESTVQLLCTTGDCSIVAAEVESVSLPRFPYNLNLHALKCD